MRMTMGRSETPAGGLSEERELMARFAAYLWGAGGTLALISLFLPHPAHAYLPGIVGPVVLAYGMLGLLLAGGGRLPFWFFRASSVAGTAVITLVAYSAHEGAPAYALLYFWVALYVFYFLPPGDAVLQIVLIAAGYAAVLATAGSFAVVPTVWLMTVGTVVVAALWVRSVVRRLRQHARDLAAAGEELRDSEARLRRLVAELEGSNRDLEEFAYISAHDLQEPLRMVASYVQLIEKRYRGRLDTDADDFIGYAVEGATRMKALITDLLDYARLGRVVQEVRPTELDDCLRAALLTLSRDIEAAGARITCSDLPRVEADGAQLTLLLRNLLSNAIKFRGASPPQIRVGAERGEDEWIIAVSDDGIGIEPQQLERIFAVFQRLHPRERFAGTGIGLAICRRVIERHGGRIWVESEPGRGSTFRFSLPVHNPPGGPHQGDGRDGNPAAATAGPAGGDGGRLPRP